MLKQVTQALDDRQTQAQPAGAITCCVADLIELFEDFLLIFGRDANAAVAHLKAASCGPHGYPHAAALGMLNGVAEQIHQHPFKGIGIAVHRLVGGGKTQPNMPRCGFLTKACIQSVKQRLQRDVLRFHRKRARLDTRNVEHLIEELPQRRQIALGVIQQVRAPLISARMAQGVKGQHHRL